MKASKSSTKRFCIVSVLILALAAVVALPMLASATDVKDTDAMGGEPSDILVSSNPDDTNQSGIELGGGEGETGVLPNGSPTSVALDATSDTLRVGSSRALTVTVSPDDATDKTVVWRIEDDSSNAIELYSDPALSQPLSQGDPIEPGTVYVKALKPGNATVTVTGYNNDLATASCTITVEPALPATHKVKVTVEGDGTAQASVSEAAPGDKVTLSYKPGSICLFKEWQVVSGGVTISDDSFTMGDQDVEVKAIFVKCNVKEPTVNDNGSGVKTLTYPLSEDLKKLQERIIDKGELTDEERVALKNGASLDVRANLSARNKYAEKYENAKMQPLDARGSRQDALESAKVNNEKQNQRIKERLDEWENATDAEEKERVKKKVWDLSHWDGADAETRERLQRLAEALSQEDATPVSETDVTIEVQVDGCEARQITDTGEPITLEVDISEELQNTDPEVSRTYFMLREHDDEIAVVGMSEPNATKLTGSSSLFSLYTVVYVDTPTGAQGATGGDAGTKASPKLANAGDPLPAAFLAAMALISAAAAVGARRFSLR